MLTLEASGVLDDLSSAVLGLASWVEYSIVVLYTGDVAIEKEEVVLVNIVFFIKTFRYLTNKLKKLKVYNNYLH